ncbi:hypothetical protein [Psychrobacter sp. WY6]|uniref:hypothetical protein n=1 Tax=Psychrobacter sp. WY6 TaxID=2708350 RepID=UPI002022D099|nr:hypothetical protein [Psychrobacter sp. WY6]
MSDKTQNTGTMDTTDHIYFAALLPWQKNLWSQLTKRVLTSQQSLPHALLAAGMQVGWASGLLYGVWSLGYYAVSVIAIPQGLAARVKVANG